MSLSDRIGTSNGNTPEEQPESKRCRVPGCNREARESPVCTEHFRAIVIRIQSALSG